MSEQTASPGSNRKQILSLAWLVIINNVLITFVWLADMVMVGRLGATAVAAVGVSGQMFGIMRVAESWGTSSHKILCQTGSRCSPRRR